MHPVPAGGQPPTQRDQDYPKSLRHRHQDSGTVVGSIFKKCPSGIANHAGAGVGRSEWSCTLPQKALHGSWLAPSIDMRIWGGQENPTLRHGLRGWGRGGACPKKGGWGRLAAPHTRPCLVWGVRVESSSFVGASFFAFCFQGGGGKNGAHFFLPLALHMYLALHTSSHSLPHSLPLPFLFLSLHRHISYDVRARSPTHYLHLYTQNLCTVLLLPQYHQN